MEIFGNEKHKIIHGDVLETLSSNVKDCSVDLIFADPPYNIGKNFNGHKDKWHKDEDYLTWCYEWLDLCIKKLNFDIYLRNKLEILSRLVWYYDSSGVQAKKYYGSMYEPILFCTKDQNNYTFNVQDILVEAKTGAKRKLIDYRKDPPQVYNTEKVPGNVWEFARVRYRMDEYENHPTQKPVALLERIIKASSNPGDLVLDPFSGTFTTCYVAKELGRNSLGIELQDEYVKIGLRRLQLATEYRGEKLQKEIRSFETEKIASAKNLQLFEEPNGTYIHSKH